MSDGFIVNTQPLMRATRIRLKTSGNGYLAGNFPDGITNVEGVPSPATIRVLYRAASGDPSDGALVAEVMSNPDGTWLVANIDHQLKYDVICRHEGYNDMILSNVSPVLATGLEFAGSLTTLDDQVEILLGTGPYQIEVVGGTPPIGVVFEAQGDFIVTTGDPESWGEFTFTLRVIDSNGVSGSFESVLEAEKPFPTEIGEAFGGGIYIGDIEDQGQMYKILVAPIEADVYGLQWKTELTTTPGTTSLTDGWSNTQSMNSADHLAAVHCLDYRGGGHDDWYMPAKDELNLFWLNIAPGKTRVPEFQPGGEQALHGSQYYWSSTQSSIHVVWGQRFSDGYQGTEGKRTTVRRVRPVRRIKRL